VQFLSFLLFVAVVFGVGLFAIVLPVMFTLGLHQQAMGDAFAVLQVMLSEAVFPLIPIASFLLVAALLGRSMCGWVCPMKVPILELPWEKFTHPECIYCLKCVDACTTKAIKPKFP